MKPFILVFFMSALSLSTSAQIKMPALSPTETITQNFGLSSIEVTYSRPSLKGRTMIGEVVPWDELWRTGANTVTRITFHDPVEIFNHEIVPGTYAIYTIPRQNGMWDFILNKGANNFGIDDYKKDEDIFREKVSVSRNADKTQTLNIQFENLENESCVLNIRWENFDMQIPIKVNFKDKLRAEIESALQSDKKPYYQAALFYDIYDHNKPKALALVSEAISHSEKPAYYVVYYKAQLQRALGDKAGALATAKEALQTAKDAKSDNYTVLCTVLIKELER